MASFLKFGQKNSKILKKTNRLKGLFNDICVSKKINAISSQNGFHFAKNPTLNHFLQII